jgi:hypothetical protein
MDDMARSAEDRLVAHYRRRTLDGSFAPLTLFMTGQACAAGRVP